MPTVAATVEGDTPDADRSHLCRLCLGARDCRQGVALCAWSVFAIGAGIHGYVPQDFMAGLMARRQAGGRCRSRC